MTINSPLRRGAGRPPFQIHQRAAARSCRGALAAMLAGMSGWFCPAPVVAQDPLFQRIEPAPLITPHRVPFPALRNMRAAWGDYDNDGWVDVVIMGESDAGPVTKLYRNTFAGGGQLGPFTFIEVQVELPQVQDGALAWGDFDNDGDLDLAITGSRSAHPEEGDLVVKIFRNNLTGPSPWDREFVDVLPGPWLRGCRFGVLQWIDYDNDGDLDLFYSGDRSKTGQIGRAHV